MSRHEVYYRQRVVPCECGSTDPYWHGPATGVREYCCDACWERRKADAGGLGPNGGELPADGGEP